MKRLNINIVCTIFFAALILSLFSSSNRAIRVHASEPTPITTSNFVTILTPQTLFPFSYGKSTDLASASTNVIIKKGRAEFYAGAVPNKGSYYTTITMKLQNYKGGSWKTIISGTAKGKGSQVYSNHYYVYKGYKYRGHSTIKIYKSKGGKLLHTKTLITSTRKY